MDHDRYCQHDRQRAGGNAETGLYYYRARYYDPATGRFISEDPAGLGGGLNLFVYVFNRPAQFADPMGLTAQDVQRIREGCMKCTQQLSDAGLRSPGSGRPNGWWNDFTFWFTKHESCYGQAQLTQPCLENPSVPYDDEWSFSVVAIEWGLHRVVEAREKNHPGIVVYCDPWRNISWTTATGGGDAF